MRKKMYWGIASLILIIGVACVYFMLQPDPDQEPDTRYIVPSETDLKKVRETRKPPREAKDGFTWEWHADHWHEVPVEQNDVPHKPVPSPRTNSGQMRNSGKMMGYFERVYKKYGVDPPPPGYAYRMSDPGVLRLHENGNPILYKKGEAVFDIVIGIGFAPSYDQYQHYLRLIQLRDGARHVSDNNRADQLNTEIAQLKANAQGEIPIVSSSQSVPTHLAESAARERSRRASEIMKQAYIDMGLGYMIDY